MNYERMKFYFEEQFIENVYGEALKSVVTRMIRPPPSSDGEEWLKGVLWGVGEDD